MTNVHLPHFEQRVEFLEIDFRKHGDTIRRFCNSNPFNTDDPYTESVIWGGYAWTCRPFESTGWKRGDRAERPSITLPDPDSALVIKLRTLQGASGADVTRYVASGKSVMAGNSMPITHERYLLNKYQASPGKEVKIELASIFDFRKSKVPSFIMTRKHYPGLGSNLTR